MPYVYILECNDGSFYTGSTWNPEKRVWEHNNGFPVNYTRTRLPVMLVYAEYFENIRDAYRREKQIQGWSRKKKLVLIEGKHDKLPELARSKKWSLRPSSVTTARCSLSVSKITIVKG